MSFQGQLFSPDDSFSSTRAAPPMSAVKPSTPTAAAASDLSLSQKLQIERQKMTDCFGAKDAEKIFNEIYEQPHQFLLSDVPVKKAIAQLVQQMWKEDRDSSTAVLPSIEEIFGLERTALVAEVQWLIERKKFLVRALIAVSPQPSYVYSDLSASNTALMEIVKGRGPSIEHFIELFTKYSGNAENIGAVSFCKMDLDLLGTFLKYFKSYLSFVIDNAVPHISQFANDQQKLWSPTLVAALCIFDEKELMSIFHRQPKELRANEATMDNLGAMLSKAPYHTKPLRAQVALFPYVRTNMSSIEGGIVSSKYLKEQEIRDLKAIREWFVCTNNILFEYTIPKELLGTLPGQNTQSQIKIAGIPGFEFPLELREFKEFGVAPP
jgi:hypothetical protein